MLCAVRGARGQLRDETCRFPLCRRRAEACDLDHVKAWEEGGSTSASNLAHLCRMHHRLKHAGSWSVQVADENENNDEGENQTEGSTPSSPPSDAGEVPGDRVRF